MRRTPKQVKKAKLKSTKCQWENWTTAQPIRTLEALWNDKRSFCREKKNVCQSKTQHSKTTAFFRSSSSSVIYRILSCRATGVRSLSLRFAHTHTAKRTHAHRLLPAPSRSPNNTLHDFALRCNEIGRCHVCMIIHWRARVAFVVVMKAKPFHQPAIKKEKTLTPMNLKSSKF